MSDSPVEPDEPRPRNDRDNEDPGYHDEEPEVQNDERTWRHPLAPRKNPRRLPPRRRYYPED
jgi:hypothetical protein